MTQSHPFFERKQGKKAVGKELSVRAGAYAKARKDRSEQKSRQSDLYHKTC
jgi:hypothetical protein